jgi:D-serine deaminase-like pyridoxal phosphate-dependent protein
MTDPGHGGVTVSTLKEAEEMAAGGVQDILYAVTIAPQKLERAAALRARGADLILTVDNLEAAQAVSAAGTSLETDFPLLIEIDTDGVRAGVMPCSEEARMIASFLRDATGASYGGLMTHAGASYNARNEGAIVAMAEQERKGVADTALMLSEMGIQSDIVSVGSTPTALFATDLNGITEVRAGVYVFQDLVMAGIGVCRPEDIALSVLTTVIGHQGKTGRILVDAGWMAMSRDRGTATQMVDQGYGLVCSEDGSILPDVIVEATSQEHGIVARRDGAPLPLAEFPIGTRLRILPNHACATAAQHTAYAMTRDNQSVGRIIERFNGW